MPTIPTAIRNPLKTIVPKRQALLTEQQKLILQDSLKVVKTASGLEYAVAYEGNGNFPRNGQKIIIHFQCFAGDSLIESTLEKAPCEFVLGAGQVIPALEEAVRLLKPGGRLRMWVPPWLGYGVDDTLYGIVRGTKLRFDISLLSISK
jgi:FKBP-type peptidyl-prolyl cis-trans isomerase FkpA